MALATVISTALISGSYPAQAPFLHDTRVQQHDRHDLTTLNSPEHDPGGSLLNVGNTYLTRLTLNVQ
jgi:hypothetical protein